ncbi:MAG: hypothetical protein EKK31_29955 [Hyphomicrobiales bacterium]|nr:MAG: hypothetical protein EKK31_29955 [Hyphomicrobiales bacterium]
MPVGRRRRGLPDAKARIVAESCDVGATVSAVARQHALSPQQSFAWRRAARQPLAASSAAEPIVCFRSGLNPRWVIAAITHRVASPISP